MLPVHTEGRITQTVKRARGTTAIVALSLALAACGGDGGSSSRMEVPTASVAVTTPTPTSTPTPAATPTPTPPSASERSAYSGVVVQVGDSIGFGAGTGWASLDHMNLGSGVTTYNVSVSGRTMADGYARSDAECFGFMDPYRPSVLLIQQGTNDLGNDGIDASALYGNILTPFVAAAHAAGFYVIVNTILPRADYRWTRAKEEQRLRYNAAVRQNDAGADAVSDLASDPLIGDAVDPATSSLFFDALHPSFAGQQRLTVLNAAALRPFLTIGPRAR